MGAVMMAATVTTARDGKAWMPAINANNRPSKLPNKKELGTWVSIDDDMTVMTMNGELNKERLIQWLETMGASFDTIRRRK
ncbi:hypothetical protein L916_21068 [Phytophthora nicotianae]|nr:hypothetical protein L916_21068 [Phytophthora nicotianae]